MAAALEVEAVSVEFAGLRALDGVSLRLEPGEILGLIGPYGSGKTTLINVISGQIAPLVGVLLTGHAQRGLHGLPPRVRQALQGLLGGDSEKQLAARLGVSGPTAHQYVGMLYNHFGVASRAELMAYFIRRRPAPSNPPPPYRPRC